MDRVRIRTTLAPSEDPGGANENLSLARLNLIGVASANEIIVVKRAAMATRADNTGIANKSGPKS